MGDEVGLREGRAVGRGEGRSVEGAMVSPGTVGRHVGGRSVGSGVGTEEVG